jgi:hypothetical protein
MPLQFPRKLFEILEKESDEIIRWLPEGNAFKIIDQNRFQNEIIPKYFRREFFCVTFQMKWISFSFVFRQSNRFRATATQSLWIPDSESWYE